MREPVIFDLEPKDVKHYEEEPLPISNVIYSIILLCMLQMNIHTAAKPLCLSYKMPR